MNLPLVGKKIAFLVANGFNEADLTQAQRQLQGLGANTRIIGMDSALINGWSGSEWGLSFAPDNSLSESLAVDFSMLVIPGGQRSIEKLKLTAHTGRFMGGFLNANKPVAVMGRALELMVYFDKLKDRRVAGPERLRDEVEQAGGIWDEGSLAINENLLTGQVTDENRTEFMAQLASHFTGQSTAQEEIVQAA